MSDELRYLPPVCGALNGKPDSQVRDSCFLTLYHESEHQAPDKSSPLDGGSNISWPREKTGAVPQMRNPNLTAPIQHPTAAAPA